MNDSDKMAWKLLIFFKIIHHSPADANGGSAMLDRMKSILVRGWFNRFALTATIAIFMAVSGSIAPAKAAVLFESVMLENGSGNAYCTPCLSNVSGEGLIWRLWDGFTLGADSQIDLIEADLFLLGNTSINFSVWNSDRTIELFSETFAIGDLSITHNILFSWTVVATIANWDLLSGDYFLSVYDPLAANSLGWWQSVDDDNLAFQPRDQNPQSVGELGGACDGDCGFRISGREGVATIPEPASLALFAFGLAGLGFMGRRRRKQLAA